MKSSTVKGCGCNKIQETEIQACGNCKFFVAGGKCQRVTGEINFADFCDLWTKGQPQPLDNEGLPTFDKDEVNYRGAKFIFDWPPKIEGIDSLPDVIADIKLDMPFPPRDQPPPSDELRLPENDARIHDPNEPYLREMIQEDAAFESKHPRGYGGRFGHGTGQALAEWDDANKTYSDFVDSTDLKGFSFDPATGKGYDFYNQSDIGDFFQQHSKDGEPVYVVGVTNQVGRYPSRQIQSEYERIAGEGSKPMIGFWHDDANGFDYTDVAFPMSGAGVNDETAIALGQKYAQEYVVKINQDGSVKLIKTSTKMMAWTENMPSMVRQLLAAGLVIQEAYDDSKHPRGEDGRWVKGAGTDGDEDEEQVKPHTKPYGRVGKGEHALGEGGGEEPLELTPQPTQGHINTADDIMYVMDAKGKKDLYTREFMVEQAREADFVRNSAENGAQAAENRLKQTFPSARVSHRTKYRHNMLEKLVRKPDEYSKVSDLKDVGGLRMIFHSFADLKDSIPQLEAEYGAEITRDKDITLEGRGDGYRALHYTWQNADGTQYELQIRTPNVSKWADWYHDFYKFPSSEFESKVVSHMKEINNYAMIQSERFFQIDSEQEPSQAPPPCPEILVSMERCL